jgi:hypothetical protein
MGLFTVKCQCGCGKKVQRGSNYFLQQARGLTFGIEIFYLYDRLVVSNINGPSDTTPLIDKQALLRLRSDCNSLRDKLLYIAHEGPAGASITRSQVEQMNLYIVQLLVAINKIAPQEFNKLNAHQRMSKAQQKFYLAAMTR